MRLIEELLASGTGPDGNLTPADLSRFSAKRRAEAKKSNPQFSLPFLGKLFGSSKCVLSSGLFLSCAECRAFSQLLHDVDDHGWEGKGPAALAARGTHPGRVAASHMHPHGPDGRRVQRNRPAGRAGNRVGRLEEIGVEQDGIEFKLCSDTS